MKKPFVFIVAVLVSALSSDATDDAAKDGFIAVELPAKSITFLTTDYEDRVPNAVEVVRIADGRLSWTATSKVSLMPSR